MNQRTEDITILLVEDDEVDVMAIKRSFSKQKIGNPFIRATDGLEALELLRGGKVKEPYIILLDLNMPRMGGIEFLREVRRDELLRRSVVFVLTTSKSDEDIIASYSENIAGYFLKEGTNGDSLELVAMLQDYWKRVRLPIGK